MSRKHVFAAVGALLVVGAACAGFYLYHNQNSKTPLSTSARDAAKYLKSLEPGPGDDTSTLAKKIEWSSAKFNVLMTQAFRDEMTFQEIRKQVLVPFEKAVLAGKNADFVASLFATNAHVNGIVVNPTEQESNRDQIEIYKWKNQNASDAGLKEYLSQFSKLDDFRIDVVSYHVNMNERAEKDSSATAMKLRGYWDLRGLNAKSRQQDIGSLDLELVKTDGQWKISAVHFGDMRTLRSHRTPAFTEITSTAFTDGAPRSTLRREAIRRGGYALALTDTNKDGNVDMYVGSGKTSELFMGRADNKFKKEARSDFSNETMVKTAIFADLDNDGDQDLFVTSFNPNEAAEDLVIYENKGEQGFVRLGDPTRGMGRLTSYYPMPAVAGDFNGDGMVDIYVGFPGPKDFTFTNLTGHEIVGGTKNVQGLFINKGGMKFTEQQMALPDMKTGSRQHLYPHSAMAVDWDKDKEPDIVVIDDQDNLSPFYKNKGKGVFEQVAEKIGVTNSSNAMSFAAGDFNNDGLMDFALTSVNLFAAQRYESAMINMWHRPDEKNNSGMASGGIRLFQQNKNGSFTEVTQAAGLEYAGEGQAGVEFVDYNNDGLPDMFVANGLWSGGDRYQDASAYLVMSKITGNSSDDVLKDRNYTVSSVSKFMNALINFKGDLFEEDFKGSKTISVGGYQRNRLFRNNGDGTFTDVAYIEGVDTTNDGYVTAVGDLNHDGKMDLVLRNGDPGQTEHMYPAVQIFQNDFSGLGERNFLALELHNSSGLLDALNTGVTVESGGLKQYKQLLSNNGAAQSQRILHFGLDNMKQADKVTIHWMEGDQVLTDIKAGYHFIERPKNFSNQTFPGRGT